MKVAAKSRARGVNVFVEAAGSGSGETVDAVVAVMVEVLTRDAVRSDQHRFFGIRLEPSMSPTRESTFA